MFDLRKLLLVSFLIFLAIFLNAPGLAHAGFGVSPNAIKEDRLVKGSHIERIVYLVQGNPEEDLEMEVVVDSPDIKEWFSFETENNFVIPKGIQQFPFKVIIDVPEDAELGIYKAFVRVNTKPKRSEGGSGVSIALGGRIDVDLTVGEGIFSDFNVRRIEIADVKEGKRLEVRLVIENLGNVPVAPERVSFELFNKYGNIRLAYIEVTKIEEVDAFKTETITVKFPLDIKLGVGEYLGEVKVYKNGDITQQLKNIFNVRPKTFLEKYWPWGTGAVLVVLVIAGFWFVRKRRLAKI